MPRLADFVKAYDVRGTVPEQLSPEVAHSLGAAFAEVVAIPDGSDAVVIGHDMRPSSPGLAGAFADGATSAGADVTMIGLASTDQLYFASGHLQMPGAMFTASHNPAQYNGIKMCRAHAVPGELGRMSWPTTTVDPPTTWTNARPAARASDSSIWSGTVPRTSYALKTAFRFVGSRVSAMPRSLVGAQSVLSTRR